VTTRVLVSGVDTLGLFAHVAVTQHWVAKLREAKKWAEDGGGPVDLDVDNHPFRLQPGRSRVAPFLLESAAVALHVNPEARGNFPQVSAELRSAFLWQLGPDAAVERVRQLFQAFTGTTCVGVPSVTRVDLCCDFQGSPFVAADLDRFTCRADTRAAWVVRRECTGFTFGMRRGKKNAADVGARIYNKSSEIAQQSPDKAWFRDVWARSADYQPAEDVWRLEFQLRRGGLRAFRTPSTRLDTWADVADSTRDLWARLTSKWLKIPGKRTERSRAALADEWIPLHRDGFAGPVWGGDRGDLTRVGRSELVKKGTSQLTGHLVGQLAAHLIDHPEEDLPSAVAATLERAQERCREKGTSLAARVEERIALHAAALVALRDRVDAAPRPAPPPRWDNAAPEFTAVDATPAAPPLPLGWGVT
jgi:hypothetical protein